MLPAIPEVDSVQADMNLVIVNKLDSLIKMADEQKKAEVEMRQDISQLKKTVESLKQQIEEGPVDKVAVKKKIPTDLSVCLNVEYFASYI